MPTPKAEVADSWEDEANDIGDTETVAANSESLSTSDSSRTLRPTSSPPSSASERLVANTSDQAFEFDGPHGTSSVRAVSETASTGPRERPEQSMSVAARLIAAGIGVKAPKRTQEQRDYDRAVKLQAKKKKDEAREAEEKKKRDKEQAQRDVWGD